MPELAPITARRAGTLVGVAMALAGIGGSAASVALPSVKEAFDLGVVGTAWVVGAFGVGVAVSAPVYGRLSDRFGSRWPIAVGFTLLVLGSVVAACAWHPAVLYLGRALTGAGAGSVPALSGILLASRFDAAERSDALARCGALSAGAAAGVLLGGFADAVFGWRSVMLLPAVVAVIAPAIVRIAPSYRVPARTDWTGIALVTVVMVGLVLVLQGSTSGAAVAVIGAALLLCTLPLLARHIERAPDGLLPRAVVHDRTFVTTAIAGMAVPASYYAGLVLIPPALVAAYDWEPVSIGLALLPAAVLGVLLPRGLSRLAMPVARSTSLAIAFGALGLLVGGLLIHSGYVVALSFTGSTVCFGIAQGALVDRVSNAVAGPRGAVIGSYTLVFSAGAAISSGLAGLLSAVASPATAFIVLGLAVLSGAASLAVTWHPDGTVEAEGSAAHPRPPSRWETVSE